MSGIMCKAKCIFHIGQMAAGIHTPREMILEAADIYLQNKEK